MSRITWVHGFIALLIALAALVLIRLHTAAGAPAGQDSITNGRSLAEAWCKKCHSLEASSPGALRRAPDFVDIANRSSTTELSLKVFLRSDHTAMPNLIVSPGQATDLAQFILSLKRN